MDNAGVTVGHYENFPVASFLCPPHLRAPVQAIYHYARTADDLADEGDMPLARRQADLAAYRAELHRTCGPAAQAAEPTNPAHPPPDPATLRWPQIFIPLSRSMHEHALPLKLLDDLLDAFVQDIGNPEYPARAPLLDYCRRSANPIGRLLLHLYGVGDSLSLQQSDAICTALQLVNFWQDPSVDLPRGRIYFPVADAQRHGLTLAGLRALPADSPASQALLRELAQWAAELMRQGAPLACRLPGRAGWELRLVVQGGLRILERIAAMQYRTLHQRPKLKPQDWLVMAWRAWRMRPAAATPGFALP